MPTATSRLSRQHARRRSVVTVAAFVTLAASAGVLSPVTSDALSPAQVLSGNVSTTARAVQAHSRVTDTSAILQWPRMRHAKRYRIFKDGSQVGATRRLSFRVAALLPSHSYTFKVIGIAHGRTTGKPYRFRVRTTAAAPAPSPSTGTVSPPTTLPAPTLSGDRWTTVVNEGFLLPAPLGIFPEAYSETFATYPYPWTDTSRMLRSTPGYYHPEKTLSVTDGVLDVSPHYDAALNRYLVSALMPRLPRTVSTDGLSLLYGRFTIRLRADATPGYKLVPLLWPASERWPDDGEIDFPEGDLDGSLSAFAHHANPAGGQDWFATGVTADKWHTYTTEWSPSRVEFFVDGRSIGVSSTDVPHTPMRWVLQFETSITPTPPPQSAVGRIQVDYVRVDTYN